MAEQRDLTATARELFDLGDEPIPDDWEWPDGYDGLDREDQIELKSLDPGSPEYWDRAEEDWRLKKREPRPNVLHQALRAHGVTEGIAGYILFHLRGEKRRVGGRPPRASVGLQPPFPGEETFWEELEKECEGNVEPHPEVLRLALLCEGVPVWAAQLICDRLAGKKRPRRGNPAYSSVGMTGNESHQVRLAEREKRHGARAHDGLERALLLELFEESLVFFKVEYARRGIPGSPYYAAVSRVAREWGIPDTLLDGYVRPR